MFRFFKKQKVSNVLNIDTKTDIHSFKKLIYEWNVCFPIDRYYRTKYNIKFGSPEHRELSFLDMCFELFEDKVYDDLVDIENYTPNEGNFLKEQFNKPSTEDISNEKLMEAFGKMDFSKFDDKSKE